MPACQLHVSMGIPLESIPQIRLFYNQDAFGESKIDLDKAKPKIPHGHCIAARITAENPNKGFQPTSGIISQIHFKSSSNVWGYFSVHSGGGLHEFADSQFGHIFAWGKDREDSRNSLIIALSEMTVKGEIATPIRFLISILESSDYRENKFSTHWLDEIISNNRILERKKVVDPLVVAICAAVYKSHQIFFNNSSTFIDYVERGKNAFSHFSY